MLAGGGAGWVGMRKCPPGEVAKLLHLDGLQRTAHPYFTRSAERWRTLRTAMA
jgi:hypothetical protein